MNEEPSRTAFVAAAARAAHLLVDAEPHIFTDTLAVAILGERAEELLAYHRAHGAHPILSGARGQVAVRSRYTEDRLVEAVERGVTQYVILGAGLDSFAYRSRLPVRVFEVDHPATQGWKRRRLESAGIAIPETVAFVGVDFENDSLRDRLARSGFDFALPSFVSWLGVTMYLTRESLIRTLAELPPGAELVADYLLPAHLQDEAGKTHFEALARVVAERGEPMHSLFTPEKMSALLEEAGFRRIEHAAQREAVDPALWERRDTLSPTTRFQLVHAR